VVSNDVSNTVSGFIGVGDLTFGPRTDLASGANPKAVGMDDFNGDGKSDIVAANGGAGTVSVWLGSGTGTFGARVDYATAISPTALAIGNLNDDATPDLAVACASGGSGGQGFVSVLLGTGGGGFAPRVDYQCGANPNAIAIGDLDGQATLDIAVTNNYSNTVSILQNKGNGTLRPKADFGAGVAPSGLALIDYNGDGWMDLTVANFSERRIVGLLDAHITTAVPDEVTVNVPQYGGILHQNFPNPFNPSTTIDFVLPDAVPARLAIFNVHGVLVRLLADGTFSKGLHRMVWDGRDKSRTPVASGVYFYRLDFGGSQTTRRMVLLK
jgi:hypothetical protein